jgi:tetratricopeptide (TPR) repeat protein
MKSIPIFLILIAPVFLFAQDIANLTAAINAGPSYANYVNRGHAYNKQGSYALAVQDFTNAIRLRPNIPAPYSERAYNYLLNGQPDSAVIDYTAAIRIDRNYLSAYTGRGIAYYNLDQPDAAIVDYNYANRLSPGAAIYDRANVYLDKGEYGLAINDFRKVIAADTANGRSVSWAYAGYILALIDLRKFDDADREYDIYQKKHIQSYLEQDDFDFLRSFISICVTDLKGKNHTTAATELVSLLHDEYHPASFQLMKNFNRNFNADILACTGWVYEQLDSLDQAQTYYRKASIVNIHNSNFSQKIKDISSRLAQRNKQDLTVPEIELIVPTPSANGITAEIDNSGYLAVYGKATDPAGIKKISVAGTVVTQIGKDGAFRVRIRPPAQELSIMAWDNHDNLATQTYKILSTKPLEIVDLGKIDLSAGGKFYAIFIACSAYNTVGLQPLPKTVPEADSLRQELIDEYNFLPENIDTLYNMNRGMIYNRVMLRIHSMSPQDNLLVFYSGHGALVGDASFWVPLNATSQSEYLSNDDIDFMLGEAPALHVLVITDACFGGGMRSGLSTLQSYQFKLPSRQLIASGGVEPVPGISYFTPTLIRVLRANTEPVLQVFDLYTLVSPAVKLQSGITPVIGDLQTKNSMGGVFYFKRK